MPLSFGIAFGVTILIIGAILFAATDKKKLAKATIGIGAALTLLTLAVMILAVISPM